MVIYIIKYSYNFSYFIWGSVTIFFKLTICNTTKKLELSTKDPSVSSEKQKKQRVI